MKKETKLEIIVVDKRRTGTGFPARFLDDLLLSEAPARFLVPICAVEVGPEKAPINGILVQDDAVLLVVSRVARDCNHRVDARRQLAETEVLHCTCGGERLLRVVQHVPERVHPDVKVARVDTHRLLAHG